MTQIRQKALLRAGQSGEERRSHSCRLEHAGDYVIACTYTAL